jgi:hypothetical protein
MRGLLNIVGLGPEQPLASGKKTVVLQGLLLGRKNSDPDMPFQKKLHIHFIVGIQWHQ